MPDLKLMPGASCSCIVLVLPFLCAQKAAYFILHNTPVVSSFSNIVCLPTCMCAGVSIIDLSFLQSMYTACTTTVYQLIVPLFCHMHVGLLWHVLLCTSMYKIFYMYTWYISCTCTCTPIPIAPWPCTCWLAIARTLYSKNEVLDIICMIQQ